MSRILVFLCLFFFTFSAHAGLNGEVETWIALRDPVKRYDFTSYNNFLNTHANWPDSALIALRAEEQLLKIADGNALAAWFKMHPPQTDAGRLRYVRALAAMGNEVKASALLTEYWQDGYFDDAMQPAVLLGFGNWLKAAHHEARLDTLLWEGRLERAQKTLAYIDDRNAAQIGAVRIRLQRFDGRAVSIAEQCRRDALQDNGLIFDLVHYYLRKGDDGRAIETLNRRRNALSPHDKLWWRERSLLARRALEHGDYKIAYDLARTHGHESGSELSEAEWLAGWLAVTRLKNPQSALAHFTRMYNAVKTPISIARAAYWAGIAAEQLHDKQLAAQWYEIAALHMNTFYGQLAAYALGTPREHFAAFLRRDHSVGRFSSGAVPKDLIGAARILRNMNRLKERDMFLRAALRVMTDKNQPQDVIAIARELGSPPIALQAAKAAYDRGVLVADALFPQLRVPSNRFVEPALTLGIIRQESMFDPMAVSAADARGLMQLLPGTARQTARQAGLNYESDYALFQPQNNMVLGQNYLMNLLARYGGFVPLAAASYNAGPGNVDKWLHTMGDPRRDPYSWADWVERIPFYETRNYVQRVWESYTLYQYLLRAKS